MRQSGLHTGGNRRSPGPVGPAMAIRKLKLAALREWERLEARIAAPGKLPPWRPLARRALALAGKLTVLAVLPFFVLVRGSVLLYTHRGAGPWLALAGGAGCTLLVVTAYAGWLSHRLTGRVNVLVLARRVALQLYFWSVGLGTLRHVGTGDHLHVELRLR